MTSLQFTFIIQTIMSWLKLVSKAIKSLVSYSSKIQLNHIAKASLVISILLIIKKLTNKQSSAAHVEVILERISDFYNKIKSNQVKNVQIMTNSVVYLDSNNKKFQAMIPRHAQNILEQQLKNNKINYSFGFSSNTTNYLMIVVIWAIAGFFFYRLINQDNLSINTSSKPQKKIKFENIVGLNQAKQSLSQVIQYMKNPTKYSQIGARMRRGIIFYGPSGTGKTTLAKATAGQAQVDFFSCNASQFCQIYVGVGPKKVKQLFKKAKSSAPSIIYIDQIDAIGNRKGMGLYSDGAGSEKNSTINQLLSQMDGFSSNQNILVIGSTNRIQMIDQSLLRAGRFDLKIKIPLPNHKERHDILKYHLSNKKTNFDEDFIMKITQKMDGWSGADLQNLANQSVYKSLRSGKNEITGQILLLTYESLQQQIYY